MTSKTVYKLLFEPTHLYFGKPKPKNKENEKHLYESFVTFIIIKQIHLTQFKTKIYINR